MESSARSVGGRPERDAGQRLRGGKRGPAASQIKRARFSGVGGVSRNAGDFRIQQLPAERADDLGFQHGIHVFDVDDHAGVGVNFAADGQFTQVIMPTPLVAGRRAAESRRRTPARRRRYIVMRVRFLRAETMKGQRRGSRQQKAPRPIWRGAVLQDVIATALQRCGSATCTRCLGRQPFADCRVSGLPLAKLLSALL